MGRRGLQIGPTWVQPSMQEWLETDGLGGFASSTTSGVNTRRYHGWLFLASEDPGDRWLALSKMHDLCRNQDGAWDLSSSFYPGALHPKGVKNLAFFSQNPFPAFTFKLGNMLLTREIFMVKGVPGVFVCYRIGDPWRCPEFSLSVDIIARPLCNYRYYHNLSKAGSWSPTIHTIKSGVVLEGHPACGGLALVFHKAVFRQEARWYYNMLYPGEKERGLDYAEDHLSPGVFEATVSTMSPGYFWAGPVPKGKDLEDWVEELPSLFIDRREQEVKRREGILGKRPGRELRRKFDREFDLEGGGQQGWESCQKSSWAALSGKLAFAGDQFVVSGKKGTSIIAGYHWFGEWGRDTFISLPGLLISTGRQEEARSIFRKFAGSAQGGIVPNVFGEGNEPHFNSVDASLWMVYALRQFERQVGDSAFVLSMLPFVTLIIRDYACGKYGWVADGPGGLLRAGSGDTQITWMDATCGGVPVTPRDGYPVEVNALWISALNSVARWSRMAGAPDAPRYEFLYRKARASFIKAFSWDGFGLYDRISREGPVEEIRPNQVIAAGLDGVGLPGRILSQVWKAAVGKLLTPRGLRTLAPDDPHYVGYYRGSPVERDRAYHQGTAWPWLLGPLFDLAMKLDRIASSGKDMHRGTIGPHAWFVVQCALPGVIRLGENPCLGTIFEVASGDWPYEPGGAVAQAWSVAEAQRIVQRIIEMKRKRGVRAICAY